MNSKLKATNGLLIRLHRTAFLIQNPKKSNAFVKEYQILKFDFKTPNHWIKDIFCLRQNVGSTKNS